MAGQVREALRRLRERLAVMTAGEGADSVSSDLLGLVTVLGSEHRLRNLLADPGADPDRRASLARSVLAGKVGRAALSVVEEAVRERWARPRDLVDELEVAGVDAAFGQAEAAGTLDRVEDELFRFGRAIEGAPALRQLLDDPHVPVERKRAVVSDLLDGRADPTTVALAHHLVGSPRGRHIDEALSDLVTLASRRREELLAEVTVAAPLEAAQEQRMVAALERVYGRAVRLQVAVDPTVLGGARVVVGDEVIDGTVVRKLEQARRQLVG